MRVITGKFKGRRLESPKDDKVRPTTDKVKEALFSIIQNNIQDRVFCDLFAGVGGLGLEAISRGAKKVYFCDNSKESLKIINMNVNKCNAMEYADIKYGDYKVYLENMKDKIDVFLLDPPYYKGYICDAINIISEKNLLNEDGIILAEHPVDDPLPDIIGKYKKYKDKKYGKLVLSIFM